MKKPNKRHKKFVRSVLKEKNAGRVKHLMMNLPEVYSSRIDSGWITRAEFQFHDGTEFYDSAVHKIDTLKKIFKQMLRHWRVKRRGV